VQRSRGLLTGPGLCAKPVERPCSDARGLHGPRRRAWTREGCTGPNFTCPTRGAQRGSAGKPRRAPGLHGPGFHCPTREGSMSLAGEPGRAFWPEAALPSRQTCTPRRPLSRLQSQKSTLVLAGVAWCSRLRRGRLFSSFPTHKFVHVADAEGGSVGTGRNV
jgi:hypothetical protein